MSQLYSRQRSSIHDSQWTPNCYKSHLIYTHNYYNLVGLYQPTNQPTQPTNPTQPTQPTNQPAIHPTNQPTKQPTQPNSTQPSNHPSTQPTIQPNPTNHYQPSNHPSNQPTTTIQPIHPGKASKEASKQAGTWTTYVIVNTHTGGCMGSCGYRVAFIVLKQYQIWNSNSKKGETFLFVRVNSLRPSDAYMRQ